ncbi:MAG: 5'-nucleotidase, lipoprotein e(P4) family [Planctomycetota bacterium]
MTKPVSKPASWGIVAALLAVAGCAAPPPAPPPTQQPVARATQGADPGLNAVLWAQRAVEHDVAVHEAYALATLRLEDALQDPTWTAALEHGQDSLGLPPAVILDADETVLDNSAFQARLATDGADFDPKRWAAWVQEQAAPALPGAKEFVARARARGVAVFFVTNRKLEAPTVANIVAAVDPLATPETVLCKGEQADWGSDKTSRRALLAKTHRIVLLIGDDYNDFTELGQLGPDERRAAALAQRERWGRQWILIPQAMYGNWERALYGYDGRLSAADKLRRKLAQLRPQR